MKTEPKEILKIITAYLEQHPQLRFTQAIFNLDINQSPEEPEYQFKGPFRDNYSDKDDEVLICGIPPTPSQPGIGPEK